jgi:hypothetical protein
MYAETYQHWKRARRGSNYDMIMSEGTQRPQRTIWLSRKVLEAITPSIQFRPQNPLMRPPITHPGIYLYIAKDTREETYKVCFFVKKSLDETGWSTTDV